MATTVMAAGSPAAVATDPIFIGWTKALPPLPSVYTEADAEKCARGTPGCVDATLAMMRSRLRPLADECDHDAVFALAYLRTTEEYQRVAAEPGFFEDVAYVNTEDAVFAAYYFDAYDAWHAGQTSEVPRAWSIAFDTAENVRLAGAGDLLLGLNAHINRDLPLVLASLGVVTADGGTRKPDHDSINVMLNRVVDPLLHELADWFDPTIDDLDTPYGLSWTTLMQILMTWREAAWRNAELLVNAPDDAARSLVVAEIEAAAATNATAIRTAYTLPPLLPMRTDRDAYCAARS